MRMIEELTDQTDILNELVDENNNFDLDDFYLNDGDASVIVITPNQSISAYSKKEHAEVIERIYKIIYPWFDGFGLKNYYVSGNTWSAAIREIGNVVFQLASDADSIVWIPNKINKYQYDRLLEIKERIENLNEKRKQLGKKAYRLFLGYENQVISDEALSEILNNIVRDEKIKHEENLLSDLMVKKVR